MSANNSSECSQTAKDGNAVETSNSMLSTTEGSDAAVIESASKQDASLNPADDTGLSCNNPAPSIGNVNDKALSNPQVISTATGVGGQVVPTTVSSIQVCPTASAASPRLSLLKAQTTPTQPAMAKTVAPTLPRTPAPKSSVAMVRPPQTASVQLPATFQIPPGKHALCIQVL